MIIETPIGKDKIFQIDTEKLEYDKKGKIVNYPQPKGCVLRVFASTEPLVLTQ